MAHMTVDLGITVGRVRLKNPILTASGTFGYGSEFEAFQDLSALGGLVTKGLTLEARPGNPPRRIAETAGGMINSIGLQNVGADAFLAEKLPYLHKAGTCVIVNLNGRTPRDYVDLAELLDAAAGAPSGAVTDGYKSGGWGGGNRIDGLELNVSCPNVEKGGREFGTDPNVLYSLVYDVRQVTRLPLWVKLSPSVTDLGALARAAEAGGADAVVAINTLTAAHVNPVWEGSRLRADVLKGGLSGPAVKPVALRAVWEIRQAVKIPIVGVGGVASAEDVLEFLAIGAQAVQVGTANFHDPSLAARLPGDLERLLAERGVKRLEDLVRGILALEQAT